VVECQASACFVYLIDHGTILKLGIFRSNVRLDCAEQMYVILFCLLMIVDKIYHFRTIT
jgi:hypothetical protein